MNRFNRLSLYFWILLLINLAFIAWSKNYLKPLSSGDIIQFEVAKTLPVANSIIADWKENGKIEKAIASIQVDYVFIALYTALLMVAVLLLSRLSRHVLLFRTGKFILILLPIAAICDVVENIAMARSLSGHITAFLVTLAYDMAVAKFTILILTAIFLFTCLLFWVGSKFTPRYRPIL
jgi:hypothetical protein